MVWLWFPLCRKETYRILISLAPKSSMNETAALHSACVINGLHACKCLIQYICSKCFQKGGKKKKENISSLGLMYVTWQHEYIRSSTETYNSSTVHWIFSLFVFIWPLINVLAYCLEISSIFLPFWLILSILLRGYDMPSYKVTVSWQCFWALCSGNLSIFQYKSLLFCCAACPPRFQGSLRPSAGRRLCWRPNAAFSLLRISYIIFQT